MDLELLEDATSILTIFRSTVIIEGIDIFSDDDGSEYFFLEAYDV